MVRGFTDKQTIFTPSKFVSRIEADAPTTKLYRFHGALIHPSGERVPIATECLLLRESRLKVYISNKKSYSYIPITDLKKKKYLI